MGSSFIGARFRVCKISAGLFISPSKRSNWSFLKSLRGYVYGSWIKIQSLC
jgi:hypothetical protein